MIKSIDISCAKLELLELNLIRIIYNNQYEIKIEDMVELDEAIVELIPSDIIHLIIDATTCFISMTPEVQKYFAKTSPLIEKIGSTSIILSNLPNRIIVRFYLANFKPIYPVKIFKTEAQAILWSKGVITP